MVSIYKRILLAVDDSENSDQATREVIELQKEYSSEVVLFHSVNRPRGMFLYPIDPIGLTTPSVSYCLLDWGLETKYERAGRKILEKKKKMFDEAQLPVETRLIKNESPEDYIERITEEEKFDLVVLGLKGVHSKLMKKFMRTVAEKVIKLSPCDILVVQ